MVKSNLMKEISHPSLNIMVLINQRIMIRIKDFMVNDLECFTIILFNQ
jgi:hypothetical protein